MTCFLAARTALEAELRTRPEPNEDIPTQRLPYLWGMFQGWVSLIVGLFAAIFLIPALVSGMSLDDRAAGYAINRTWERMAKEGQTPELPDYASYLHFAARLKSNRCHTSNDGCWNRDAIRKVCGTTRQHLATYFSHPSNFGFTYLTYSAPNTAAHKPSAASWAVTFASTVPW